MASVRQELELLHDEVTDLVAVAEGHSELSSELLDRVRSFESDVVQAIEEAVEATSFELAAIRDQFSLLQSEVSRAIAVVGVLHYKGQVRQAEAIERLGNDQVAGAFISGLFGAIGSAVLGMLAKAGIEAAGDKIAEAVKEGDAGTPKSEQELKRLGLLGLIHDLEARRPYLTFKFIVDAASSEAGQMFSQEEARLYLSALIGEGALERYQRGNIKALRLNPKHPRVKALARPNGKSQESSR